MTEIEKLNKSGAEKVFDDFIGLLFNEDYLHNKIIEKSSITRSFSELVQAAMEEQIWQNGRGKRFCKLFEMQQKQFGFPFFIRSFLQKNFVEHFENGQYHFYYMFSFRSNTTNLLKIEKYEYDKLNAEGFKNIGEISLDPVERKIGESEEEYSLRLLQSVGGK